MASTSRSRNVVVTCHVRYHAVGMMASAHVARPSALLCLLSAVLVEPLAAAKTCAVKWAQYLDGTVVAVVQLQREGRLCEGEIASGRDPNPRPFLRLGAVAVRGAPSTPNPRRRASKKTRRSASRCDARARSTRST